MNPHAAQLSRSALRFLAHQVRLRSIVTTLGAPVSRRFVAGESLEEALEVAQALGEAGLRSTLSHLNEDVQGAEGAAGEVGEYLRMLARLQEVGAPANVSLKLTRCGLRVSPQLALENARAVVGAARERGSFVRIDMEESAVTQVTLDLVRRLHAEFGEAHVGVVLQARLYRTEADLRALCAERVRIRLCKGGYPEPAAIAFQGQAEVDASYVRCLQLLLESARDGVYHAVATHDERMLVETLDRAQALGLERGSFEFQMLNGIRRDLQELLVEAGFPVRVYVPYGRHWYPYFMRRLKEHPSTAWHVLREYLRNGDGSRGRGAHRVH